MQQKAETLDTIALLYTVSEDVLDKMKTVFKTVHYYPEGGLPSSEYNKVNVWATAWRGLPDDVTDMEQVGGTRLVQLRSAGADHALSHKMFLKHPEWDSHFKLCSSSGIHTLSIPPFVLMSAVSLNTSQFMYSHLARRDLVWPRHFPIPGTEKMHFTITGKTVGMLGYGAIARETARLFKCLNAKIIAANSSGVRKSYEGYRYPNTGDPDGSVPVEFYSTSDAKSLEAFLGQCDILVATLPSTAHTRFLLSLRHFEMMPSNSILINVGRGDLFSSDDLLAALESGKGVSGAGLDVTDPEPLSRGHALFSHPRVIITPHISGEHGRYCDLAAELVMENVLGVRNGKPLFNVVPKDRGY